MDLIQIKSNMDLFSIQYHNEEDSERLSSKLKKYLLTEILKEPGLENKTFFETCLAEARLFLSSSKETGYPCVIVGCRFQGRRHPQFIKHIKQTHPNQKNLLCNFRKECKRILKSVKELEEHVRYDHMDRNSESVMRPPVAGHIVDQHCKCARMSCGEMKFSNLKNLMKHYNSSFHANEERPCIFRGCRTILRRGCPTSGMNHFRIKHKTTGNLCLKPDFLINQAVSEIVVELPPQSSHDENMHMSIRLETEDGSGIENDASPWDSDSDETLQSDDDDDNMVEDLEDYYLEYYSNFLNKLAHINFVPHTTVQEITEENIASTKKSLERHELALRKSLLNANVGSLDIETIIDDVYGNDPFLKAQLELNTDYKRTNYIQKSACYVHPQEIILNRSEVKKGGKKDVYHYVSVIESLKVLVADTSFKKMISNRVFHEDDKLRDLKDGLHFKSNEFFQNNRDAYTAMLYSDAVEMKNPLGSAKGSYKIVQVFLSICEVEKSQRSQIDRYLLVMVFREKLLKKYSLKKIMEPLVEDLKLLETGIDVKVPESRKLKCGVLCYTCDNLEATVIGGFSGSFSSRDICRICHIQHSDLKDKIADDHDLWSREEYDAICTREFGADIPEDDDIFEMPREEVNDSNDIFESDLEADNSEGSENESREVMEEPLPARGLKSECPFNVLQSFHAVGSIPLDMMHDLFEGEFMIQLS